MSINPNTGFADNADWGLIPDHMHGAVQRYLTHGISGGSFLTEVLSDSLTGAVSRGDETNREHLVGWALFMVNYMNYNSYGTPEKVKAWIKSGGAAANNPI
jgi:hypothetical protein